MTDLAPLVAASPAIYRLDSDGLHIGPVPDVAIIALNIGPRVDVGVLSAAIGVGLPGAGRSLAEEGRRWLNVGPRAWLAMVPPAVRMDFALRLRAALGDTVAALTDVSDTLVMCEIRGGKAQALLAQGVGLDLGPRLPIGHVTRTRLGVVAITIVREGEDAFRIAAPRPHAAYVATWLRAAAQNERAAS